MSQLYRVVIQRSVTFTTPAGKAERAIVERYGDLTREKAEAYRKKFGAEAVTIERDVKSPPKPNYRPADPTREVEATRSRQEGQRLAARREARRNRAPSLNTYDPAAIVNAEMRKLGSAA